MTTYQVDMTQVDYIVGEMASITSRINQTLGDLDNQSKVNLSQWTSDAKAVYAQTKQQWDNAAADMTEKVALAVQLLGSINANYYAGEKQGVSIWGG
ncbi:WXG100 family type VII secretion target [Streptomyces sp. NPDC054775]